MRNVCRVFFREASTLRSFYWFESAPDHSIYFGSSNTRQFKTGQAGTATVAIDGTRIDPMSTGRAMTHEELKGKYSIHGSGIVNLPVHTAKLRRERHEIAPPKNGFCSLPVVGILPMEPARYPLSAKTPKPTDLILDVKRYSLDPIGLLFYLNNTDQLEPPPVVTAKPMYKTLTTESIPFGGLRLCVSLYAQPSLFKSWQHLEVAVLAHPQSPGEQANWPFFG